MLSLLLIQVKRITASNREAVVINNSINYAGPILPGDILLVHHNVFEFYYDMKERKKLQSYFEDKYVLLIQNSLYV